MNLLKLINVSSFFSLFLLIPTVLSSSNNIFLFYINDSVFIKNQVLGFLPFKDQINFMLTCRTFYHLLDKELEELLKILSGNALYYSISPHELKMDIRRLYFYYKLERQFGLKDQFSLETFYKIIEAPSSYFTSNKDVIKLVEHYNEYLYEKSFRNFYPFIYQECKNIPHFPELSLILLKSKPDREKLLILLQNAIVSPFLFNNFFKYLVQEVFHIERNLLVIKLKDEFLEIVNLTALKNFQDLNQIISIFLTGETFVKTAFYVSLAYFGFLLAIGYVGPFLVLMNALQFINLIGLFRFCFYYFRNLNESFHDFGVDSFEKILFYHRDYLLKIHPPSRSE